MEVFCWIKKEEMDRSTLSNGACEWFSDLNIILTIWCLVKKKQLYKFNNDNNQSVRWFLIVEVLCIPA